MKNNKIAIICRGALIAALYVCLSVMPVVNTFSYGPVQFRIAEVFMAGCALSPSCVVGVSIGCFLANLFSPYGINLFDLVLGTFATVIAAGLTYFLRNVFCKNKFTVLMIPLPTIVLNALIVGNYLPYIIGGSINIYMSVYCMSTVALGEAAVLYIIGIPLYKFAKKKKLLN